MDSNPELHGFMARAASRRASSTQPCFRAALSVNTCISGVMTI